VLREGRRVKIAVVTPRYGVEVAGGAETAARLLATRLATRPEFTVVALTTCALDAATWADHYPQGVTDIDGVHVHRFPVKGRRSGDFDAATDLVIRRGRRVTETEQRQWIDKQGPVAPALIDAIADSDADVIAFHPFLYHPTVAGIPRVATRAVLHPAAHDEPMLRLPLYREVFGAAAGLAYWSDPERHLVEQRFEVASKPAVVVGLGVDPGTGDLEGARAALGLDDRPYLLCLGRVDDGKGARLLAECFARYKERRGGTLRLVFAGPVVNEPRAHPDIVVAGAVDEAVKWGLLRGALALVSPSAFESFSIVLMEAWTAGTPALVNSRCAVTLDHARRSGGGLAFGNYAELEVEVDRLVASPSLRTTLGRNGKAYVDSHYRWDDVLDRYATFVEGVDARARR
jgi:glycosyltransferase involved in cell wall biosynthesis